MYAALGALYLMFFQLAGTYPASTQQVANVDGRVSVHVENITIGNLLRLWDMATEMESSIPPELAEQTTSVSFAKLPMSEAAEELLAGLDLDYVFIEGRGIIITGISRPDAASLEKALSNAPPAGVIPTPFGPIRNTGRNAFIHLPPIPGEAPLLPFFAPSPLPASAPDAATQDDLFRPISIRR
jgi:hypothetical protein